MNQIQDETLFTRALSKFLFLRLKKAEKKRAIVELLVGVPGFLNRGRGMESSGGRGVSMRWGRGLALVVSRCR